MVVSKQMSVDATIRPSYSVSVRHDEFFMRKLLNDSVCRHAVKNVSIRGTFQLTEVMTRNATRFIRENIHEIFDFKMAKIIDSILIKVLSAKLDFYQEKMMGWICQAKRPNPINTLSPLAVSAIKIFSDAQF